MRKQVQTNVELACYGIQLELQIAKYFRLYSTGEMSQNCL